MKWQIVLLLERLLQVVIENDEQFELYKNKLIEKWKPILEQEKKSGNDFNKAIRKHYCEFFVDIEPIWGYALLLDLTGRIENLADIKEIPYGRNT